MESAGGEYGGGHVGEGLGGPGGPGGRAGAGVARCKGAFVGLLERSWSMAPAGPVRKWIE